MPETIAQGLLIPFIGTSLGAACVLFMKKGLSRTVGQALIGFAAGIMVAASVWSLLIPAIEQSAGMGRLAFLPATVGFCLGMVLLMLPDLIAPCRTTEDIQKSTSERTSMLVMAVVLHNIPEGMAVGIVYAGYAAGAADVTASAALMLSLGIAIQNFPEGAIISMPLAADGMSRRRAFAKGVLSGVVEPVAGVITVLLSWLIIPVLPYLLGFAAGAMIYVVVEELVPEMSEGNRPGIGLLAFMLGFAVMMMLDVMLG